MDKNGTANPAEKIANLELIFWVDEASSMRGMAQRDGLEVQELYQTYDELYEALVEHGSLVIATPKVDVIFSAVSGVFEGNIVALRQSGRNVRRFLIRESNFDRQYGTVRNCLDHILSNNAVDCELELKHLFDMADALDVSATEIDVSRDYSRLEVDVLAALQMVDILQKISDNDSVCSFEFELGFCAGRLFSSAQNLVSLEPDARKADDYERSYRERGKKGKSKNRRAERLDHLFTCIESLVLRNPAFSRLKPIEAAKLASQDAVAQNPSLWSQGLGQLEQYLTCYASETKYQAKYRTLFPETG